ncbi:hypothetical protein L1987_71168 [Smallanthus sonchifolius]|uniref:Uncharacterized protein n=1 Tax=Smallanthus sonchifolius TaxID=185202 RepID=A0ACB9ATB7_9ASTR|nr:hypothetical protein L1987_71168 [Smallanthus sonchifolius]
MPEIFKELQLDDVSDSESTESDDHDPDAEREENEEGYSPPLESSSRGNRKETYAHDQDYNPNEDLDQEVTEAMKRKTSRPNFVTKPFSIMVQEGVDLTNTIFS